MTRAELEQVRYALTLTGRATNAHNAAKAIIDAELAKPGAREWRMCYVFGQKFNRDGFGEDGPWDSEVQARAILAACSAMPDYFVEPELHSRIKAGPAGPWGRAE